MLLRKNSLLKCGKFIRFLVELDYAQNAVVF